MNAWLALLRKHRAIAVIRSRNSSCAHRLALAAAAGDLRLLEITWDTPGVERLVPRLRQELPDCVIGVGTLLNRGMLEQALACGAQFCFSPHTDLELIAIANAAGIPLVPGALTPTEIVRAWQGGASSVKVFPAGSVGGPAYVQSLQGPLGSIPLVPTGGITMENAAAFLQAGAIAVGLAGSLFPKSLVAAQDWHRIAERCRCLAQSLQNKNRA
ncbi:bifunctional 4-hydroxy-2-oxoglutarate aldolase/2-dehydro-3-deoxy-phosphogluconate aldolase [Leptolyngbya sp. FACHB-261]|uniref:bifunctional 4-hydroxy-2-oxoglutarate aldolase/2-dehydro-3-deoxy-phosphogluconate aldolase n=1 Tax=Leptolyngbya sp. FACHB-261 TaxID=2692806 RepID=UPI001683C1C2|nr:bifunctional 4-hydroxy-2-oxoglutarate aldolase/2-dehydro-3-deoxy-phosphogluconate aldolase [Leptolyngbya sp. FACHB-261]MBD2100513.1 bifunctional 4-hydroxy-2-oxoglutarate aldolase/2-dehydro-3-deoxy-phosphogluconate aldolase [Leptolyngbya sp. FACHB-261]